MLSKVWIIYIANKQLDGKKRKRYIVKMVHISSCYFYIARFWLLFFTLFFNGSDELLACPTNCTCLDLMHKVVCKKMNFTADNIKLIAREISNQTKVLDLSYNHIEKFEDFVVLPGLEELILSNNVFKAFPKKISNYFPNLTSLRLTSNQISLLEQNDFIGFNMLNQLRVDFNMLTVITTGTFELLGNLRQLFLGGNKITRVEEGAFRGLGELTILNFDRNKLTKIPLHFFNDLKQQTVLVNLPYNMIETVPNGLFTKLKRFGNLDLGNNKINKIADRAFVDVSIDSLNLMFNNLTYLSSSSFKRFKVQTLTVFQNPIHCDCKFAKVLTALHVLNTNTTKIIGLCSTPSEIKNQDLNTMYGMDSLTRNEKLCTICDLKNTCLNDGVCIPINKTQIQCNCTSDFKGEDCGICVSDNCTDEESTSDRTRTILLSVLVAVFAIVVIVVLIICFVRHEKKKNEGIVNTDGKVTYHTVST